MATHAFWAVFCSSRWPSQISPTTENEGDFFSVFVFPNTHKPVTHNERPKMKKDTFQKSSPFPQKRTAFLLGTSPHFRPSVVRYGYSIRIYLPFLCFLEHRHGFCELKEKPSFVLHSIAIEKNHQHQIDHFHVSLVQ